MKKFIRIVAIIFVSFIVTTIAYVQINKYIFKERVFAYLIEEKNYNESQIQAIEGHYGKLPSFYTTVVFENEPQATYLYFAHNDVYQAECYIDGHAVDLDAAKREGKLLNVE